MASKIESSIDLIENPALVCELLRGRALGYPLHQISAWEFTPAEFESDGSNVTDRLQITINDKIIAVTGRNLAPIHEALASGNGFILREQGERFLALGDDGSPVIGKIEPLPTA
jgi:hypothetical protein